MVRGHGVEERQEEEEEKKSLSSSSSFPPPPVFLLPLRFPLRATAASASTPTGNCHRSGIARGSPVSENQGAGEDEEAEEEEEERGSEEEEEGEAEAPPAAAVVVSSAPPPLPLAAALGLSNARGDSTFLKASRARSATEGR